MPASDATTHCVWPAQALLGEGPVWSARRGCLWWVDLFGKRLLKYQPRSDARIEFDPMPLEACAIAERERGGLIAAVRDGFVLVDESTAAIERITYVEGELAAHRFNDGKCDALGNFWSGTMDFDAERPAGSLFRLDPSRRVTVADAGYRCPNGPAWSLDGSVMYHTDTMLRTIYAFDCHLPTGALSNRRPFVVFDPSQGFPDGMTVDAEDHLWVAHWRGGRVSRFTPGGDLAAEITVPAPCVTSCSFGGSEFEDLFITTARHSLSPRELAQYPLSGGLFVCRPGMRGVPAMRFAG